MEPRRYKLVADDRKPSGEPANGAAPSSPIRRRYALARLAPSPRSALGVDRLERMEEIARRDRRP